VDLNSFRFIPFDLETGKALQESVAGDFTYLERNGLIEKRVVVFVPRLPMKGSLEDAGFKPGRRYLVHLNGMDEGEIPLIRSLGGKSLAKGFSFSFLTPPGPSLGDLFLDPRPGGPGKKGLSPEGKTVKLNYFLWSGFPGVLLDFDRPLAPGPSNISPANLRLEYKDPLLSPRGYVAVPARTVLVRNEVTGSRVCLLPEGVLPANAEIRVVVEKTLKSLAGRSNEGDPRYDPLFGAFRTEKVDGFIYDALALDFREKDLFDPEAIFREPPADWSGDVLKPALPFSGKEGVCDFHPTLPNVFLDTDFCTIIPRTGRPYIVKGGVFRFRNIIIPPGVEVVGRGSNPLVLTASGKVVIEGTLSVDGKDVPWENRIIRADTPSRGGEGVCGGGRGGDGSPETKKSSAKGEDGFGPDGNTGGGGRGGHSAYGVGNDKQGAGGGGGSFTTKGDPGYMKNSFSLMLGKGGDGSGKDALTGSSAIRGGAPGPVVWKDGNDENDFYGRDVRVVKGREVLVTGELKAPIGGSGGGGGGDRIPSKVFPGSSFPKDARGGGGGGGGGVLIIQAAGSITVTSTGRVSADGGNGSGGDDAGSCNQGGGGGGGSGGMVLLVSGERITIEPKGSQAILEGRFPVSADGGIGATGTYGGGGGFSSKYPTRNMGRPNRGGFGGMGLVEFMAPNPARNIRFTKGQVKPAPILLPAPFGPFSRARTRWIYTGATARQSVDPKAPRYLDPALAGGKGAPCGDGSRSPGFSTA